METVSLNPNLVIAVAVALTAIFVGIPFLIQLARVTSWGRRNRSKLDAAQRVIESTQDTLNHTAGALKTVVGAVEHVAASIDDIPGAVTETPAEEIKRRVQAAERSLHPGTVSALKSAIRGVRAELKRNR